MYQVYKAVEEKNGRGTVRKKWWVKGRLFVNDEVVRLLDQEGESSLQAT